MNSTIASLPQGQGRAEREKVKRKPGENIIIKRKRVYDISNSKLSGSTRVASPRRSPAAPQFSARRSPNRRGRARRIPHTGIYAAGKRTTSHLSLLSSRLVLRLLSSIFVLADYSYAGRLDPGSIQDGPRSWLLWQTQQHGGR